MKFPLVSLTLAAVHGLAMAEPATLAPLTPMSPEIAKAEMEKLIKEKTSKGYVEAGGKAAKAIKPAAKAKARIALTGMIMGRTLGFVSPSD